MKRKKERKFIKLADRAQKIWGLKFSNRVGSQLFNYKKIEQLA